MKIDYVTVEIQSRFQTYTTRMYNSIAIIESSKDAKEFFNKMFRPALQSNDATLTHCKKYNN